MRAPATPGNRDQRNEEPAEERNVDAAVCVYLDRRSGPHGPDLEREIDRWLRARRRWYEKHTVAVCGGAERLDRRTPHRVGGRWKTGRRPFRHTFRMLGASRGTNSEDSHGETGCRRQGTGVRAEGPEREDGATLRLQRPPTRRVLLSEGRHAGMHAAVVQSARRVPATEEAQGRCRRHQPRHRREAEEVR